MLRWHNKLTGPVHAKVPHARRMGLAVALVLAGLGGAPDLRAAEFAVRGPDGVEIRGVAERAQDGGKPRLAMIFVAGTGLFDREGNFGQSGTPRDLVFKDLAERMRARGVATIRYDMRGIRHGTTLEFDRAILAGRTTSTMRDDLGGIYAWARSADGLGAACVGFFAHSEGMLHVARLAESGAPTPAIVIGMGAAMESPKATVLWQMAERDATSLERMDANRDGTTTNDEVKANIAQTPSGVHGVVEPYLLPSGGWTAKELATLRANQLAMYAKFRELVLIEADSTPYPDAQSAMASYQWWKSWFIDDRTSAERLANWQTRIVLHYGDKDSQTPADLQLAAARAHLRADMLKVHIHPDRGHTLGSSVILGPIDEAIANVIAEEAASAACPPG